MCFSSSGSPVNPELNGRITYACATKNNPTIILMSKKHSQRTILTIPEVLHRINHLKENIVEQKVGNIRKDCIAFQCKI